MRPRVSIVVAVYNVRGYLTRCLDSLVRQTYENLEIIIVDDGSTDDSGKIANEYAERDERIEVVHQKNQGLSAARNTGIKKSAGQYLVFIDGDDYVDAKFVEILVASLHNAEIGICGYKVVPDGGVELPPRSGTISGYEAVARLLAHQENVMVVTWNKIYHKDLFKGIEFPVGEKNEDSLTTYKILAAAQRVAMIDEPLYYYVQREGSIMDKINLSERLQLKRRAAKEARVYFANDKNLADAAEVAELLAVFSYLDNILSGRLNEDSKIFFEWIEKNRCSLLQNKMMGWKLKSYVRMATCHGGVIYKMFRRIKN